MKILLYGATGAIADSFFTIVKNNRRNLNVVAATCNTNYKKLEKIRLRYNVKKIGINNSLAAKKYISSYGRNRNLIIGNENFSKLITKDIDVIILAISGLSPLSISLDILRSGKLLGLANKECIISLGPRLISLAKKYKTKIIPLDSEHNSIYRLLELNNKKFKSITITASGGPFLNKKISFLKNVTPKQAIKHPVWKMGKKISVDSATMMNKALEIIEAKYLFDLSNDQINAVIHPESIIHASINFDDSTSICLLSKPDMKIPLTYLLNYKSNINNMNEFDNIFNQLDKKKLTFYKINPIKVPAIKLAYEVLDIGGLAPHIFNYNNEFLVNKFLLKQIKFTDIVRFNKITIRKFFKYNKNVLYPNFRDLHNANVWINKNIFLGKI